MHKLMKPSVYSHKLHFLQSSAFSQSVYNQPKLQADLVVIKIQKKSMPERNRGAISLQRETLSTVLIDRGFWLMRSDSGVSDGVSVQMGSCECNVFIKQHTDNWQQQRGLMRQNTTKPVSSSGGLQISKWWMFLLCGLQRFHAVKSCHWSN